MGTIDGDHIARLRSTPGCRLSRLPGRRMVDARAFPRTPNGARCVDDGSRGSGLFGLRRPFQTDHAGGIPGLRRDGRSSLSGRDSTWSANALHGARGEELLESDESQRTGLRRRATGLPRRRHRHAAQGRSTHPMTRPGRPRLSASTDPGPLYIDAADWKSPVDFAQMFGNSYPVELEIGCGRGLFLAREGLARPGVNLVGLEVAKKIAQLAAFRCLKANATNVRVLVIDARKFLALIPPGSLAAVHIYFPDPWWKRRHRKRRIVAPDVLCQLQQVMARNARVHLATDVQEYFHAMQATFDGFPAFVRGQESSASAGDHQLDYLTHFERKF